MNQGSHLILFVPLLILLSGSACKYQLDPNDPQSMDLRVPEPDLRMAQPDLASIPDLGGVCSRIGGQRACSRDETRSGACTAQEEYLVDRVCTGSGCADGHCRRPGAAARCVTDKDCAGDAGQGQELTCQPFTTLFNTYDLYCAPPPGAGSLFDQCDSHAACAWNVCYTFLGAGAGGRCTRPCKSAADCGPMGTCGPLDPIIEGFRITTNFCVLLNK